MWETAKHIITNGELGSLIKYMTVSNLFIMVTVKFINMNITQSRIVNCAIKNVFEKKNSIELKFKQKKNLSRRNRSYILIYRHKMP